jgi:hypothetical protein
MCFYYDQTCEVWRDSYPKARKQHKCVECHKAIHPGETYHRVNYIFDGSAGSWAECSRCHAVRAKIAEIEQSRGCHGAEAWCPTGELSEAITDDHDHYGFMRRDNDSDVDYVTAEVAHLFPDAVVGNLEATNA